VLMDLQLSSFNVRFPVAVQDYRIVELQRRIIPLVELFFIGDA
jgi:hypothetical protein